MPKFEEGQPNIKPSEWSPNEGTKPETTKEWVVDAFAVDWPLNGDEERFAHDLEQQTLDALRRWGKVDVFRFASSVSAVPKENEGVVFPRLYTLDKRSRDWFVQNGYFEFDDEVGTIRPTEKWMNRFSSLN